MSVTTSADEHLIKAKDHINDAYKELMVTLDPETWGSNDFSKEYTSMLEEVLLSLHSIKRKIKD